MAELLNREGKIDNVECWLLVAAKQGWMAQLDPLEYETPDAFADDFELPEHDRAAIRHMAENIVDFVLADVPLEED